MQSQRTSNKNQMRKSVSLPVLDPMNGKIKIKRKNERLSLPPPLESPALIEQNKENIPISFSPNANRRQTNKRRRSVFDTVPPLEVLSDEKNDERVKQEIIKDTRNETKEMTETEVSSEIVLSEECEESGDVIINTLNVDEDTNNNNNNNSESSSYSINSNGRLLESEQDWYRRAKVTYGGSDGRTMIFRPLRMKCTHCDEAYTKTHDLYAHIRSHQNHTKCPHCGKILTCMATFVYHVRTHTAEKPYYCPCDGCDFKNAVKYNLKVHLACIRHGGKDNLKKYATVLDLDVCEKSLRKRKDNSVHELGSRRSKRRRKMNNERHPPTSIENQAQHHYYPKQEECDQFATQLLFSLSGIPPVFDQNMPMNQGMMDWASIIGSNNVVKSEQGLMDAENKFVLKPEYYDPLYGYYGFPATANITNAVNTNSMSTSTERINNDHNHNHQNDANSDGILIPKQEPIYHPQEAMYNPYQQQQMQQHYYYGSGYYYDPNMYNNGNANTDPMQPPNDEKNKKKFDLPPLQFPEFEMK